MSGTRISATPTDCALVIRGLAESLAAMLREFGHPSVTAADLLDLAHINQVEDASERQRCLAELLRVLPLEALQAAVEERKAEPHG